MVRYPRPIAYWAMPFELEGVVVHGEKRGRELDYPTANLLLQDGKNYSQARCVLGDINCRQPGVLLHGKHRPSSHL